MVKEKESCMKKTMIFVFSKQSIISQMNHGFSIQLNKDKHVHLTQERLKRNICFKSF